MKTPGSPLIDALATYDALSAARRSNEVVARLEESRTLIAASYARYVAPAEALVGLTSVPAPPATAEDLCGNYSTQTVGGRALRGYLFRHAKRQCCLCNAARAATLDHYLPQATFPEFAVLPTNLVPACFPCNTDKNETYVDAEGAAVFVHAYFDWLDPSVQFLVARVKGAGNRASIDYELDTDSIADPGLAARVAAHFRHLDLRGAYTVEAAGELAERACTVAEWRKRGRSADEVAEYLAIEACSAATISGPNHWKTALLTALAGSATFCAG